MSDLKYRKFQANIYNWKQCKWNENENTILQKCKIKWKKNKNAIFKRKMRSGKFPPGSSYLDHYINSLFTKPWCIDASVWKAIAFDLRTTTSATSTMSRTNRMFLNTIYVQISVFFFLQRKRRTAAALLENNPWKKTRKVWKGYLPINVDIYKHPNNGGLHWITVQTDIWVWRKKETELRSRKQMKRQT